LFFSTNNGKLDVGLKFLNGEKTEMILKILADRFNYQEAVNETKEEWLENLLIFLGVDIQEINELDDPTFTNYLYENNIDIVSYSSLGALSVEFKGDLVGEFAGPELTMRKDKDTGELYYEIEIECWSIIEENIDLVKG